MRPNFSSNSLLLFVGVLWALPVTAHAKELDAFTDRDAVLAYYGGGYRRIESAPGPAQVDAVLDRQMNLLLRELEQQLRKEPPANMQARDAMVRSAFQHRLLPELVTPYEEWVKRESGVPLYRARDKGIYGNAVDYDDMKMAWYIELSPVLMVSGVLIGIDKLGHYLAQGFQYYEQYQHSLDLEEDARLSRVRAYGHAQEVGQLGLRTGGVYSFADLASNWDGMVFFLALFDDVEIAGERHARYFARDASNRYRQVRDFHWSEWIKPDWDEALNPSHVASPAFHRKIADNFSDAGAAQSPSSGPSICDRYRADPAAFLGPGARQALRPRATYTQPERAAKLAPYSIDVRELCTRATPSRAPPPSAHLRSAASLD